MPASWPVSVRTGNAPQSLSHISALAAARFVCGWHVATGLVNTSFTVIVISFYSHSGVEDEIATSQPE
jgi:hypothetical protein